MHIASAASSMNTRFVKGRDLASDGPLQLYVDGTNGDDAGDGLSRATAKAHVQAAVDAIPAVIYADVTVNIAGGTYEERVLLADRAAPRGHRIVLREDSGDVTITGSNERPNVLVVRKIGDFLLEGIDFRAASGTEGNGTGVMIWNSVGSLLSCNSTNNGNEGLFAYGSVVTIVGSSFSANRVGIDSAGASVVLLENVVVTNNSDFGLTAESCGRIAVTGGPVSILNNTSHGCRADDSGFIDLGWDQDVTIQGNDGNGEEMLSRFNGKIVGCENATIDGPDYVEVLDGICYPGRW